MYIEQDLVFPSPRKAEAEERQESVEFEETEFPEDLDDYDHLAGSG
jgi:hypothetical protein